MIRVRDTSDGPGTTVGTLGSHGQSEEQTSQGPFILIEASVVLASSALYHIEIQTSPSVTFVQWSDGIRYVLDKHLGSSEGGILEIVMILIAGEACKMHL